MSTPLFCPVCEFVMNNFESTISYYESQCCFTCQNEWGKDTDYSDIESLPKYKEYIEKRYNQTKKLMPIFTFD